MPCTSSPQPPSPRVARARAFRLAIGLAFVLGLLADPVAAQDELPIAGTLQVGGAYIDSDFGRGLDDLAGLDAQAGFRVGTETPVQFSLGVTTLFDSGDLSVTFVPLTGRIYSPRIPVEALERVRGFGQFGIGLMFVRHLGGPKNDNESASGYRVGVGFEVELIRPSEDSDLNLSLVGDWNYLSGLGSTDDFDGHQFGLGFLTHWSL